MKQPLEPKVVQLLFILCLLQVTHLINAQDSTIFACDLYVNYTSLSPYHRALNLTLASLAANASRTGYFTTATADQQGSEVSYGLIQCRGYASMEDCEICANTLSTRITQLCPNKKEASIFNENCTLTYADWDFFSTADITPRASLANKRNVSDPNAFSKRLQGLLTNLSSEAATVRSKLAAGRSIYSGFEYVYAMEQCTLDISESDCKECLQVLATYIPRVLTNSEGGKLFSLSCNLRFEIYPFFQQLMPPPVSSPPPSIQPDSPSTGKNSANDNGKTSETRTVTLVVIPVLASVAVLALVCYVAYYFLRVQISTINPDGDERAESLLISLDVLKAATSNFSSENKLGEDRFGPIYLGKLPDGQEVAVRRLSTSSRQGLEDLKTEVMLLAKLLHKNLVRLLGFCLEEEEKILVYEYLPNGGLDKILNDHNRRFDLDWGTRYKIIIGIARGLLYLHDDSQLRIIHRDLKASNILLDESMSPKISGFGLARLFHQSETQNNTNQIAGSCGNMAPEYIRHDHFSVKSDVYSFGILVLEIVTGRRNNARIRNSVNLQSYVWDQWSNGMALELRDPTMGNRCANTEALKCIHIGLLCVQESVADRPVMSEVVMMLSSHTVTYPTPLQPAFFINRGEGSEADDADGYQRDSAKVEHVHFKSDPLQLSINDVSITDLYPR